MCANVIVPLASAMWSRSENSIYNAKWLAALTPVFVLMTGVDAGLGVGFFGGIFVVCVLFVCILLWCVR